MSDTHESFNKPVASLKILHAESTRGAVLRPIRAGEQFDVGRKDIQQDFAIRDVNVSSHHLRFHCVVFEASDANDTSVPPLVYVAVLSSNPVAICEYSTLAGIRLLKKSDPAYLLNDGDVMYLNDAVSISYQPEAKATPAQSHIIKAESQRFADQYLLMSRMLGAGAYGSVFLALNMSSRRQLACKVVRNSLRQRGDPTPFQECDHMTRIQRESTILQMLDHPNIIRLEKMIRTTNHIYLFKELILGGDLMSFIQARGNLSETNSLLTVRQVLKAVEYLHDNGVAHRDIKPENILLTSWRDGDRIVLTDFGGAIMSPTKANNSSRMFRMQTVIGTPGYQAPEMFNRSPDAGGYTPAADIWSIGCLTVSILTGNTPYEQTEYDDLATQFNSSKMQQRHAEMLHDIVTRESLSHDAMDFIRKCLLLDADARPSAGQALGHTWFTNPLYAKATREAYERATSNWVPRDRHDKLMEVVDTSDVCDLSHAERTHSQQRDRSRFFGRSRTASSEMLSNLRASPVTAPRSQCYYYSQEL